jgi:Glyoxalase/Bleomycin resistance protein/Dioxygenase superfamily
MKLNHLALAVRDQHQSMEFFATYFGFDPSTARRYPDGVIIIRDAEDFALA